MACSTKDLSAAVIPSKIKVKTARVVLFPGERKWRGILWLFSLFYRMCWLFITCWLFILLILLEEEVVMREWREGRKEMKEF